ncbi:MAG: hypothetical protein U0401_19830 [Anaerolineae bacterium]
MKNSIDTTSPGDKPLSDAELMNLLVKVCQGELSPEEAERLLSGRPEFEPTSSESAQQNRPAGHTTSAPLGQAKQGTLIIDTLAAYFTVNSARLGGDLFQAHYAGSFPSVWVDRHTVTARFNYFSLGALREWLRQQQGDHPQADFTLNEAIPWQVELHSHMTNLTLNLAGVQLAGLEGNGSMNNIKLTLAPPLGHVPIHYDAVASAVEIRCPAQYPLRVEIHGNTNAADILGRKFASKSAWQTPGFETAPNRYSIVLSGEASSLTVTYE